MNEQKRSGLLAPVEAAQWLKVKVQTLALWRSKGKGPRYCKIGRAVRYRLEDLEAYAQECLSGPGTESSGSGEDERLSWRLVGFFIRDGMGKNTREWGLKEYEVKGLVRDERGRLIVVDEDGQVWRLVDKGEDVSKLIGVSVY